MRTYKWPINELSQNQIFVFGSNTQGRHGKGAALWAKQNAGAIYGVAAGIQGRSYAIITKDLTKSVHPSVSKSDIVTQIETLYYLATKTPQTYYLIAYSANPNSPRHLNGYTLGDIVNMFIEAGPIPDNIVFEQNFAQLIEYV